MARCLEIFGKQIDVDSISLSKRKHRKPRSPLPCSLRRSSTTTTTLASCRLPLGRLGAWFCSYIAAALSKTCCQNPAWAWGRTMKKKEILDSTTWWQTDERRIHAYATYTHCTGSTPTAQSSLMICSAARKWSGDVDALCNNKWHHGTSASPHVPVSWDLHLTFFNVTVTGRDGSHCEDALSWTRTWKA